MNCSIVNTFFECIEMAYSSGQKPLEIDDGVLLYKSEITFLQTVDENPDSKVSDLSSQLGITKGAITQMGDKLCEKALTEKYSAVNNKKERFYRLTKKGKMALESFNDCHKSANDEVCEYFSSLGGDDKEAIIKFFDKLKSCLPIAKFRCNCKDGCINCKE